MTISSQSILNGSPLNVTAKFDPTIGNSNLKDMICEYSNPRRGETTRLTTYHTVAQQIIFGASLSAHELARLKLTSSVNETVITVSPITFDDEKRIFYCSVEYYVGLLAFYIRSDQHILETVYSKLLLFSNQVTRPRYGP